MRRLRPLSLSIVLVVLGTPPNSDARPLDARSGPMPIGESLVLDMPQAPAAELRGGSDVVYFGGNDGPGGIATQDGVWDFEDGTLQGWTSTDLTFWAQVDPAGDPSIGGPDAPYFRRITAADFSGATTVPVMTGTGSLWVGANDEEAAVGCWPGGLGYDNDWNVAAIKTFTYGGTGTVTLSFDYFTDSETQFDYTFIYTDVAGARSLPLNSSAWDTAEGWGYSGAVDESTNLGTPSAPLTDTIVIETADLPAGVGDFDVVFLFDSDPLYSDGLDSFSGFLNSRSGPFGFDDFAINGVGLSETNDFETDADGWSFATTPAIGSFLQVVELALLDPVGDPCDCPITLDPDNDYVMVASDWDGSVAGGFPHPERQNEQVVSNPVYVGPGSGVDAFITPVMKWDVWEDTPQANGVGYSPGMFYYPWTCPESGTVGWSVQQSGSGFIFSGLGGARCTQFLQENQFVPADVDSIKLVFEILADCDDFGITECELPEGANQSPYWDNFQLGMKDEPTDAPAVQIDLAYQDVFPRVNSLFPAATADIHSYYDNNRSDGDATNANMGDSCVVVSSTDAEVFLNFRIYPGPSVDDAALDAVLIDNGGVADGPGDAIDDGGFLAVRMEPLPVPNAGLFVTYRYDGGTFDGTEPKILPDDVLTPGSTVEYFFSARSPGGSEVSVTPDTTDVDGDGQANTLEFDVLPGYRTIDVDGEPSLVASCLLYVDAFNGGAQIILENEALRPILGTSVDVETGRVRDTWDRYDYTGSASSIVAPLARESNGDNGMTKFHSLVYRTILYNTGTFSQEGLRNGDAELLNTWLSVTRPGDDSFTRGLWLSGDGIASILSRTGRHDSNLLISAFAGAAIIDPRYSEYAAPADSSFCVRLDGAIGAPVNTQTMQSLRGNGCPTSLAFDVMLEIGDGLGDLVYVDQDAGETVTPMASVANQGDIGDGEFRTVIDGFSLHHLRETPAGWTGDGSPGDVPGDGVPCSDYAVRGRVEDVFAYLNVPSSVLKDPSLLYVDSPEADPYLTRTQLFRNSPNPFNPRTVVRYEVGTESHVRIGVYDVNGRLVRTLVNEIQPASGYSIAWDGITNRGERVSSGVYWARMQTSTGFESSTKMVVLK